MESYDSSFGLTVDPFGLKLGKVYISNQDQNQNTAPWRTTPNDKLEATLKTRKIIRQFFRKPFIAVLTTLVLIACSSVPEPDVGPREAESVKPEPAPVTTIDTIMTMWLASVRDWNPDAYAACYWPDARYTVIRTVGQVERFPDRDAMMNNISTLMQNQNLRKYISGLEMTIQNDVAASAGVKAERTYISETEPFFRSFVFEQRDGEWKISNHTAYQEFAADPPSTPFLAWADADGNNILQKAERDAVFGAIWNTMLAPGVVDNPSDELYDWNDDGSIDADEAGRLMSELFWSRPLRFGSLYPASSVAMLDPDGKGWLNIHNANALRWTSAGQLFHPPGAVRDKQDALKDFDGDEYLSLGEITLHALIVSHNSIFMDAEPFMIREMSGSAPEILNWADWNGDGKLQDHEKEGIAYKLFEVMENGKSVIVSPMEKAFDANDDGLLDKAEAANIRSTFFPTWVDGKEWNGEDAISTVDAWLAGL